MENISTTNAENLPEQPFPASENPFLLAEGLRSAEEYEDALDKEGTLPKVRVEALPHIGQGTMRTTHFHIKDESEKIIGNFTLNTFYSRKRESNAYLNTILIDEEHRGKGYGKAAYVEIIKLLAEQKIRLNSGFQLSRGSAPIWEWLAQKGVARQVETGEIDETVENAAYSSAVYEIV